MDWEEASMLAPDLPKGWYELMLLDPADRVEFVRDHWVAMLPYVPHIHQAIEQFFSTLEDVDVYLAQKWPNEPFGAHMVYSQRNEMGFYHGCTPATAQEVLELKLALRNYILPVDYLAFLQLHNGFAKVTDTGVIPLEHIDRARSELYSVLASREPLVMPKTQGEQINPAALLPFYQSFGMDSFQVFFTEWYPEQEMGNLYYSGLEHALSDFTNRESWSDNLAFPTFLDWLVFYLEVVIG